MDTKHCQGCRDNFYNGQNPYGIKECWLLSGAKLITRYKIGMWDSMGKKSNFHKVKVPQCYSSKGSVFVPKIPSTAV
jgi:hypothetical protein